MCCMGYCWKKNPSGQFVDEHERAEIVYHRQSVFLPTWTAIEVRTRAWKKDNMEEEGILG